MVGIEMQYSTDTENPKRAAEPQLLNVAEIRRQLTGYDMTLSRSRCQMRRRHG
jgi:hypothetical protein